MRRHPQPPPDSEPSIQVSFRPSNRLEPLLRRAFSAQYDIGSFLDLNEIEQAWALYRDRDGISAQNHQDDSEGGQVKQGVRRAQRCGHVASGKLWRVSGFEWVSANFDFNTLDVGYFSSMNLRESDTC